VFRAKERDPINEEVLWIWIGGSKRCDGGDMVRRMEFGLGGASK